MSAIRRAVDAFDGTQADFARAIGRYPQEITRWLKTGRVPPAHCIAIETAVGRKVTRYELRPDIYGSAPATTKRAA